MAAVMAVVFGTPITAAAQEQARRTDSIEVSLLTCAPGNELYSLYGHTALRYHDLRTGEDWTFNYGVFSFRKPFFALRFVFGQTDYELGVMPFNAFREEYRREGRAVTEQVLNLSADEKRRLYDALADNYRPENRTYRYNFFYDNCTTRARDMVERCIAGTIEYAPNDSLEAATYRQMIHAMAGNHRWATFGNDLCLGAKADTHADSRQQQFLPEYLMRDFDRATIATTEGRRPLVKETRVAVDTVLPEAKSPFPLTPRQCATILLLVSLAVAAAELRRKKAYRAFDALLLTCTGVAGIIVTALLFSEHPTTSTNLQVLLLNPLPLFFMPSVMKGRTTYWRLAAALSVLFLAGAIFQDYAEGMEIVALCLLSRCMVHLALAHKQHPNRHKQG